METITDIDDQWIRNILNKKQTNQKKIQEKSPLAVLHGYLGIYLDLLQSSQYVSMEARRLSALTYEVFKTLNDLNLSCSPKLTYRKGNPWVHFRSTKFGNKRDTHMELIVRQH